MVRIAKFGYTNNYIGYLYMIKPGEKYSKKQEPQVSVTNRLKRIIYFRGFFMECLNTKNF